MKSKLFKTLLTPVVTIAIALGAGTQLQAAPVMQDQAAQDPNLQKPSPSIYPAPPADQVAPQPSAPGPLAQDQNAPQYSEPQYSEPQPQYQPPAPPPEPAPALNQPRYAMLSPQQLHQLVAPIALYPDALVAQILAASAYPTQIVEAHRFLQQNPDLKGQQLGDEVDQQDWDPSVKALCQFPSVLANLDRDLSWTSELGDANYNQAADVMAAIQYMRHKAEAAGNLRTTPQQRVYDRDDQVEIEPADPQVVYVPQYNPGYVYGYPVGVWPGFYPWWGFGGPFISFGIGFPLGPFFGFGWGWHAWGLGWGFHGGVFFGGHPYAWHGAGFYSHAAFVHGNYRGFNRGGFAGRGFAGNHGYAGGNRGYAGSNRSFASSGNRGYASRGTSATRSGSYNRSTMGGHSFGGRSGSSGASHSGDGHISHSAEHSSSGHFGGGHSGGGGHGHGR